MLESFNTPDGNTRRESRKNDTTPEKQAFVIREMLRDGDLTEENLRLAAHLGSEPAQIALGNDQKEVVPQIHDFREMDKWLNSLAEQFGQEVVIQANLVTSSVLLPFYEAWAKDNTSLSEEQLSYPRTILREADQLARGENLPIRESVQEDILSIRRTIRTSLRLEDMTAEESEKLRLGIHKIFRFYLDTLRDAYQGIVSGEQDGLFSVGVLDYDDAIKTVIELGYQDLLSEQYQEAQSQTNSSLEALQVIISQYLIQLSLSGKL